MSISLQTPRLARVLLAAVATALTLSATANSARAEPKRTEKPQVSAASHEGSAAGVVNLNSATEDELMRLPGVGPSKARAIVALRGKLGKFSRVEDLMRVKGIGRKTFRKLAPMLRLDGPTTLAANRPAAKNAR